MKKITISIKVQEPLLAAAPGSDPNMEESFPYIPGSLLRGAAARKYLQQGGQAGNGEFSRLFLDGRTRFLNAYPLSPSSLPMSPTPKSWLQEKDPPPERKGRILDMLFKPDPPPTDWPKATRRLPIFFAAQSDLVTASKPGFEIAVHNARDPVAGRATKLDGAIFRYQALARGQQFSAEVWGSEEELEIVKELLQGTLLLGGSRSAGYGLVLCETGEPEVVAMDAEDIKEGELFYCYLAGDAIIRDPQTGQSGADISAAFASFGCEVEIVQAFTRMIWVGGFNAKWGLPLPQTWAVQQGSVWQLRAKKAIPAGTVTRILSEGVGDRRAEGFGQLLINPTWLQENPQRKLAGEGADNEEFGQPDVEVEPATLEYETADLLQTMNERLAGQELDRLLQESAIQIADSLQGNLSHSQIGRLRQRIRDVQANSGGDLSGFAAYLAATKDRKSADEQFRKVSIKNPVKGRQNFRDWMRELAGHPANVWEQIGLTAQDSTWQKGRDGLWQRSFLGNQPLVLNQEKANYYAARLIEAVCELLSRGETK